MNDQTENTENNEVPAVASAGAGGVSTATAHEADGGNSVSQTIESGNIPAEQNTAAGEDPSLEEVAGEAQQDAGQNGPIPAKDDLYHEVIGVAQKYVDQGRGSPLDAINQIAMALYVLTQPADDAESETSSQPEGDVSEAA